MLFFLLELGYLALQILDLSIVWVRKVSSKKLELPYFMEDIRRFVSFVN
jgi:hypothetical protein